MSDPWKLVFRRLAGTQSACIASIRTSEFRGDLPAIAIAFKLAMEEDQIPDGDAFASALGTAFDDQFFDELFLAFVEVGRRAIARRLAGS